MLREALRAAAATPTSSGIGQETQFQLPYRAGLAHHPQGKAKVPDFGLPEAPVGDVNGEESVQPILGSVPFSGEEFGGFRERAPGLIPDLQEPAARPP